MSEPAFPPIQQRLMEFIRREFKPGYNHYNVSKLIGDASARQYFRYGSESGRSFILAAYPEAFDPDRFSYKQVYDLFREIGLPVPEILAIDGKLGIVLQEDLGNESLQRRFLTAGREEKVALLKQACDLIRVIQEEGTGALRPNYEATHLAFDEEKLNWELRFFRRNYLENYRKLAIGNEEALMEEFNRLARELAAFPRFLCHRDFHIRNLMVMDGRLYVIDFQDARWGPPSYDPVSLLKDSIDLDVDEVNELVEYFLKTSKLNHSRGDFTRQFHLMCVQRLLKALGTYGYQIVSRGNFIYEQYMAGSLNRALHSLKVLGGFPVLNDLIVAELEQRPQ